jgi:Uncharacterized conserved protein
MLFKLTKESEVLLQERVRTSRIIGSDKTLVLHGGGNTSVKGEIIDHTGKRVKALFVKGSGSDLATIDENGFTALRLDDLLRASSIEQMTDLEMTEYFKDSMVAPDQPSPSVETFLHAFVPFEFVDHSHADYILAITNTDLTNDNILDILGRDILIMDYVPPGFPLAKEFMKLANNYNLSEYKGVVLRKHGLITWGKTAQESLDRHLEIVNRAKDEINKRFNGMGKLELEKDKIDNIITNLPKIRGKLSSKKRKILNVDLKPEIIWFSTLPEAEEFQSLGPATPDMIIRTKFEYVYANSIEELPEKIEKYAARYEEDYKEFINGKYPMHDPYPNVIIIKGLGMITSSTNKKEAKIVSELMEHSIYVNLAAKSFGKNKFISKKEGFEMEYWSLEEAKFSKIRRQEFEGYVGVVTGAASGIGKSTFIKFYENGIIPVGLDLDLKILDLSKSLGNYSMGIVCDITKENEVTEAFNRIVLEYGGLDIVFNNAGYLHPAKIEEITLDDLMKHINVNSIGTFLITREAFKIMKAQNIGGNFVFNITKNLTNPGAGMLSYGSSKAFAAQVAKYVMIEGGPYKIRSNIINPDKIFKDSKIWEGGVLENRAKTKGMTVEEYKKSNLLKIEVLPEHVANVVIALIKDDTFGATTGAMIPVDGGII